MVGVGADPETMRTREVPVCGGELLIQTHVQHEAARPFSLSTLWAENPPRRMSSGRNVAAGAAGRWGWTA